MVEKAMISLRLLPSSTIPALMFCGQKVATICVHYNEYKMNRQEGKFSCIGYREKKLYRGLLKQKNREIVGIKENGLL